MERVDRWQNVVTGAFRLSEETARGRPEAAREYLDNVIEVFEPADPVDDWEGYAVRRMAIALREALDATSRRK